MNEKNLRVQTRGLSRPTSPGPSAQSSRRSSFSERQSPTESSHKPLKERTSSFTKNVQQRIAGMSSNNPSLGTSRSFSSNNLSNAADRGRPVHPSLRTAVSASSSSFPVSANASQDRFGMLNSPSMVSLASTAGPSGPGLASSSSSANLISKFDARNVALAMHRLENKDSHNTLDARPGELGNVGAIGFGGGDEWQTVCVRVLPLFNGEGTKGYIEDLNDLVSLHIQRITSRSEKRAIQYLAEHLRELLSIGMLTLNSKVQSLSDERLLIRLNEVWTFFFTSILPYLEGVFLPFSTNRDLTRIAAKQAASNQPLSVQLKPALNVRRLILLSFRDQIIYPITNHLVTLFAHEAEQSPSARMSTYGLSASSSYTNVAATPTISKPQTQTNDMQLSQAKRLQMISILASCQTDDDAQAAMEHLARSVRGAYKLGGREGTQTPEARKRNGSVNER